MIKMSICNQNNDTRKKLLLISLIMLCVAFIIVMLSVVGQKLKLSEQKTALNKTIKQFLIEIVKSLCWPSTQIKYSFL
jgi:hypothetical protein